MAIEFTTQKGMNAPEFFGKLFQLRDQIHLTHLATKSYAQHIALGDFYDSILDLTDSIVEQYQGKYGIQSISIPASSKVDPIPTLKEFAKMVDDGAVYMKFKETFIQNKIDELSSLTYQTIYKLENLK